MEYSLLISQTNVLVWTEAGKGHEKQLRAALSSLMLGRQSRGGSVNDELAAAAYGWFKYLMSGPCAFSCPAVG